MKKLYFIILFSFCIIIINAQPLVGFQAVVTGLSSPVDVVNAGDTRLFIVEQSGKVKIFNGTSILPTLFLDLTSIITFDGGERGFLSLVFHPNYAINRYFFVFYNNLAGDVTLARYQTKLSLPNEAEPTSGVVLLSISKPFTNHNGGKLNFGTDGLLYFGTGDGGSSGDPNNFAQTGTSNLGKMLRLNVDNFSTPPYYTIPATNPYLSNPNINDEIIALGLRNPWRWSFDRLTGDMWLADVGQNAWEEVNYRPASSISNLNYGWRCFEGTQVFNSTGCTTQPNNVVPIFDYPHNNTNGGFSITGGYVYRGTEYPILQGYYIFADYVSKNFWLTKSNGVGGFTTTKASNTTPVGISGFGEAQDATLYALGLGNGTLYKITASAAVPLKLLSFTAQKNNNQHQLQWQIQTQEIGDKFTLESSTDNNLFTELTTKVAIANKNLEQYQYISFANNPVVYYRLKMVQASGSFTYSPTIILRNDNAFKSKVYKNGSNLIIETNGITKQIIVSDALGKNLIIKQVNGTGFHSINTQSFAKGLLIIKLVQEQGNPVFKVIN